jgi:hypothetical protein
MSKIIKKKKLQNFKNILELYFFSRFLDNLLIH